MSRPSHQIVWNFRGPGDVYRCLACRSEGDVEPVSQGNGLKVIALGVDQLARDLTLEAGVRPTSCRSPLPSSRLLPGSIQRLSGPLRHAPALPPEQGEVIVYVRVLGYTEGEAAKFFNISRDLVRRYLARENK